jgi:hypothetical protein
MESDDFRCANAGGGQEICDRVQANAVRAWADDVLVEINSDYFH